MIQTYMATKINNLEYDAPLEVRNWRHPAEIATVNEVENGTVHTVEVYTDGSKTGELLLNKIYNDTHFQEWIPVHQFGLRKAHSTIQQCHRLTDIINKAVDD